MKVFLLIIKLLLGAFFMTQLSATDYKNNVEAVKKAADAVYTSEQKIVRDLTVAQAILESNLLHKPSKLALEYNNLFGIKGVGTAGYVTMPTKEYTHDGWEEVDSRFARNKSLEDSIQQHKELLEKPRYANVLTAKTFEEAAKNVRQDGYATDPAYTQLLIQIYNQYIKT